MGYGSSSYGRSELFPSAAEYEAAHRAAAIFRRLRLEVTAVEVTAAEATAATTEAPIAAVPTARRVPAGVVILLVAEAAGIRAVGGGHH